MSQKETLKNHLRSLKFTKKKKKTPYDDSPLHVRMFFDSDHDAVHDAEHDAVHDSDHVSDRPKDSDRASHEHSDMYDEDDIFASLNGSNKKEHYRFEANRRYFTICVYAFFFVVASALAIFSITKMSAIRDAISHFLVIMSPFIMGIFIAFLVNPLVRQLDAVLFKKILRLASAKARRILSIFLAYILVIGTITMVFLYVVPQLAESLSELSSLYDGKDAGAILDSITNTLNKLEAYLPANYSSTISEKISSLLPEIIAYLSNIITGLLPLLINFSMSVAKFALNLLLSIAISIYILYDLRKLNKLLLRLTYSVLPIGRANSLSHTVKECGNIFGNFIVGKSIDSLIIGLLCFIILKIFDFPYALLVSVIVGITNMIPYFGPFIGAIPGILLYLFTGFMDALGFGIIILILQQFDGWVLGPKILGDSTGLSPIWVIFAIIVGGAYAGVLGMFLGVPVVAVIAYLSDRFIVERLKKKKLDIS